MVRTTLASYIFFSVAHLDFESQKHTNALVLAYFLRDDNHVALIPFRTMVGSDANQLLTMVMEMQQNVQVLFDSFKPAFESLELLTAAKFIPKLSEFPQDVLVILGFINIVKLEVTAKQDHIGGENDTIGIVKHLVIISPFEA
ncbi:hypothetical protein PspLS_09898 [Pyricularia sp. CBS 133598]|nr:hypothetical protein PspLS_09898 [Pyricularia sp. CBS 133598]